MSFSDVFLRFLVSTFIYPGLLFLILAGLVVEGLRRKFVARSEGREGPVLFQPVYDLIKFFRRIAVVPGATRSNDLNAASKGEMGRAVVFFLPVVGLFALVMAVALMPLPGNLWPFFSVRLDGERPLGLDLLGVVLLLQVPALVSIVLGTVGSSIYAQVAASRIAQLMVACAMPYVVAVFGPAIALGTLDFKAIATSATSGMLAVKFGCGLIFILCQPALLCIRPLAAGTGETLAGVTTNIAGPPLGLYKLLDWVERVAFALLFVVLFVPSASTNVLVLAGAVLLNLGLVGILETLFSQIRLKDALDFYLRYASLGALIWFVILTFLIRA